MFHELKTYRDDHTEVLPGEALFDRQGNEYTFERGAQLTVPGKSGKVQVDIGVLYAHIFGLHVHHGICTGCGQFVNVDIYGTIVTADEESEFCVDSLPMVLHELAS